MFAFHPSAPQAKHYDAAMHAALAESVVDVFDQAKHALPLIKWEAIERWAQAVRDGARCGPATFGAYFDLVAALQTDDFDTATSRLGEIAQAPNALASVEIRDLGLDFTPAVRDRFCRFMGNSRTDASGIAPASGDDCARFAASLQSALDLVSEAHPALRAEFGALVREIVLVAPDGSSDSEFEGGTCFKLWGALFLNATCRTTPLDLAVTLAHEEGHAYLFGACRDEMLVEDSDRERYWSRIRQSKRPLEGIFHATFVSARMIDLLIILRSMSGLSIVEKNHITSELMRVSEIYDEGVKLLQKHARFTRTGRGIFTEMTLAMSALQHKAS